MSFLINRKKYITPILFTLISITFLLIGCQKETEEISKKEVQYINITNTKVKTNNEGIIYLSLPSDIKQKGENAINAYLKNLQFKDLEQLGEKSRVAAYLKSIGKIDFANQIKKADFSIENIEFAKHLSKQEINDLNNYKSVKTNKSSGCLQGTDYDYVFSYFITGCYFTDGIRYIDREGAVFKCNNSIWEFIGLYSDKFKINGSCPPIGNFDAHYCNSEDITLGLSTRGKTNLSNFVAMELNNQLKDLMHLYIKNKEEIDMLMENDEVVKAAYEDFKKHTNPLYLLGFVSGQNVEVNKIAIEAVQNLFSTLDKSIDSEELQKELKRLSKVLELGKGQELKTALKMIDSYQN